MIGRPSSRGALPFVVALAGAALAALATAACGASSRPSQAPSATAADGGVDAAPVDASPPVRREKPFARTPTEATTIIQREIDARMPALWDCVQAYRKANRNAHQTIVVNLGIDEDGNLLGVASGDAKLGDVPAPVRACILHSLREAAFPKSHAGIITVRQTFQDTAIYP